MADLLKRLHWLAEPESLGLPYFELMMVLWMGGKAAAEPRAAAEFTRRVEAIRTGGSRRDWGVF